MRVVAFASNSSVVRVEGNSGTIPVRADVATC